jgi:hypothetical protein
MIPRQPLHRRAGCYLATSNKYSFTEIQLLLLRAVTCLLSRYLAMIMYCCQALKPGVYRAAA